MGVTRLVSEIRCVVDHAKLPNLVIVAVNSRLHLLSEKNESLAITGRRHCGEIQFEWIHLVNYHSRKPSFTLKMVENPFLRTPDGNDGRLFPIVLALFLA